MKINAVFQCKSPSLGETPCEIRKVITLTDGAYRYFKNHLTEDYPFLRENRNQMGYDNGIRQCLLVMGESSEDGILVDSSGYVSAWLKKFAQGMYFIPHWETA